MNEQFSCLRIGLYPAGLALTAHNIFNERFLLLQPYYEKSHG